MPGHTDVFHVEGQTSHDHETNYLDNVSSPLDVNDIAEVESQLMGSNDQTIRGHNFYFFQETTATDAEVIELTNSTHPVIIIKGGSLYDEFCCCAVVVEDFILVEGSDMLEGTLLLLAAHFLYGMILDIKLTEEQKRDQKSMKSRKRKRAARDTK
ncbi:uncharacterized protein LOC117173602 [Belonocnema kinseyi]|uniref:uncharacterized protein LOC117173602 n=1 Tax=Belonocnema kinseyi TaxID=2817044 RepID=UPI00143D0097|nr:uncharacterized protein LOC117173602 [Belonocnema kinseyi]